MPYEYRLLEVRDTGWEKLQASVNQFAREGFRYRDTIHNEQGGVALIFEREAVAETSDAWTAAREISKRVRASPGKARIDQNERKYPPEEED